MSLEPTGISLENLSSLLPRFLALIAARTGLQIRDKDRGELQRTLTERMAALKIGRVESYLQLLEAQPSLEQGEWSRLLPKLTNGESYFWRDKGQFSLLRNRILPELIAARSPQRSLRLWSAGCSTGEEPYSLAMLIDEVMPNRDGWSIDILGTDINPASLDKARTGMYGAWAFRGLDIAVQEKYFERARNEFQIKPLLRHMVNFNVLNLRSDEYPSRVGGIYDFDLILCRNVLIYFSSEAIAHALQGFGRSLRLGGYLLTGHAELANHDPSPLLPRAFAESVAYLKCATVPEKVQPRPTIDLSGSRVAPALSSASAAINAPPMLPTKPAPRLIVLPPEPTAAKSSEAQLPLSSAAAPLSSAATAMHLVLKARAAADFARYDEAIRFCQEAISHDSTCDDAYFIWAQVEGEQGRREEAKSLLKKVIYLAPTRFDAHLEMAALYEADGDTSRARREREAALELLRTLPETQMLESQPGMSAGELKRHLEDLLQNDNAGFRARGAR